MKLGYVYIPKCADDTYYTGVTSILSKRVDEHQSAKHPDSYTAKRLPVELVFYAEFTDINFAIDREKQIKSWSRAKKEAAVAGRFEDLPSLAKKKFKK